MKMCFFICVPIVSKSLLIVLGTLSKPAKNDREKYRPAGFEHSLRAWKIKSIFHTFHRPCNSFVSLPAMVIDFIHASSARSVWTLGFLMLIFRYQVHTIRYFVSMSLVNGLKFFGQPRIDQEKCNLIGYSKIIVMNNLVDVFALLIVLVIRLLTCLHGCVMALCRNNAGGVEPARLPPACAVSTSLSYPCLFPRFFIVPCVGIALVKAHGFIDSPAIVIRQNLNLSLPDLLVSLDNSCPTHRYFFKRGKKPSPAQTWRISDLW